MLSVECHSYNGLYTLTGLFFFSSGIGLPPAHCVLSGGGVLPAVACIYYEGAPVQVIESRKEELSMLFYSKL
jgi:hypothetical protein